MRGHIFKHTIHVIPGCCVVEIITWPEIRKWKKRDKNNRLVQLKMIEMIKFCKIEQVGKITLLAAIS